MVAFNEAGDGISPFTSINNPTTPALNSVSVAVNNTSAAAGITTTTWTKNLTSTVTPNFRATPNPAAALAEYQFSLRMGTGATVVVQTYSPSRDWVMPAATVGTVAGQPYTVTVQARTSNAATAPVRVGTRAYTVRIPSPATALTLVPDIASPVEVGGSVLFTAAAVGGATKQYQFLLDGVVVQPWSALTTWTLPAVTPVGNYTVTAQVRTNTSGVDVSTPVAYSIINPAATGVTLTANKASPAASPVDFLATGQGPAPLSSATGGGYFFRFLLSSDGGANFTEVKAWSTSRVWTLPAGTPDGSYIVQVEARTSTFQVPVVSAVMTFVVNNGVNCLADASSDERAALRDAGHVHGGRKWWNRACDLQVPVLAEWLHGPGLVHGCHLQQLRAAGSEQHGSRGGHDLGGTGASRGSLRKHGVRHHGLPRGDGGEPRGQPRRARLPPGRP